MKKLNNFSNVNVDNILRAKTEYGTPIYLYDERLLKKKCQMVLSMPNAYGLTVRYAMKANSNKSLLQIINKEGLFIDASSLNEARRAKLAGIELEQIILTTQEVPEGEDRKDLEQMILDGMRYNICSLHQLYLIGDFAKEHKVDLSIRIHPGIGAGESASRNTGDNYSCFGIHLSNVQQALQYADEKGIRFTQVHVHIGSGGDPEMWRQNIDLELDIIEKYFSHVTSVSFGGGLKEARMPDETFADIKSLGNYAKQQIEEFYRRTNRKLHMEVEPGTFIVANSGYAITKVIDKKRTGDEGFHFIIVDGGMEINTRPLLYGSRHPFYIISKEGHLISSDFDEEILNNSKYEAVIIGKCCESGDSQSLDSKGKSFPRKMGEPDIGDIVVIGGTGAYCSSMSPFNYNSHTQIQEVLLLENGEMKKIRKKQTLEQMIANEI